MADELARVRVRTQGGDEPEIETPLDIKAADFISELSVALNLPRVDAEGHPIVWRLDSKDTGRTLEPDKTLGQNGVRDSHLLLLTRGVVAG
jgi:hypothetical protein